MLSRGRIQMPFLPSPAWAANAKRLPSGESANGLLARIENRPGGETDGKAHDGGWRRDTGAASERERERGQNEPGEPGKPGETTPAHSDGRHDPTLRSPLRDPLELVAQIACVLPSVLWILGEAGLDDAVERRRGHRLDRGDRRRVVLQDRRDQRGLTRARERLPPRRHLVEHRAEREDVRPRVGLLALQLLRRHVLEGPQDRAFLRQPLLRGKGRQAPGG